MAPINFTVIVVAFVDKSSGCSMFVGLDIPRSHRLQRSQLQMLEAEFKRLALEY
jgi:hypothetical protein